MPSTSNITTPASIRSLLSSSGSLGSATHTNDSSTVATPAVYFKKLALQHAPTEAIKNDLHCLIDELENSPHLEITAATDLAKAFISSHGESSDAMECLFKYLNCRFQLDRHVKHSNKLNQRNDKLHLRQSMSQLRNAQPYLGGMKKILQGPSRLGPVVTSHPTQLNRPESTESLLSYPRTGFFTEQESETYANQLWQLAGRRTVKPAVIDEAKAALPAIKNIIQSMRKSGKELIQSAQENGSDMQTLPLQVGNWIGGDRDGNPTITPQLLAEILGLWSSQAFSEYQGKLSDVNAEKRPHCLYNLFEEAGCADELKTLQQKLDATQRYVVQGALDAETSSRFKSSEAFQKHVASLKDVIMRSSLSSNRQGVALKKLGQLEVWIGAFGFHGVGTHIRQNSEVNEQTVSALISTALPGKDYPALSETEKVELLSSFLNDEPGHIMPRIIKTQSGDIRKEVEFLESYKGLRARYGDGALPTIITANTETLSDMLEVCILLKFAGLYNAPGVGMNVVPLIETVPDMRNAKELMTGLLSNTSYKAHLKTAGDVQQVMLGYSDSMRGNGIVSAAWESHKRPGELKEVADAHGVKLHFFHGRGGTEARGSRDNYSSEIGHLDGESLQTGFTQTEQGEEVFKKFGNRQLSDSSISELISATFETNAKGADEKQNVYGPTMDTISTYADAAYQDLYKAPELASFLQQTTPLSYVGLSNAGSRPASRIANLQGSAFLAKLRAIPYVAAWYQSCSMAPAYFGIGSGIQEFINNPPGKATEKIANLKDMYHSWPFFQNLIDRAETAMNKADMSIARHYAELSPDNLSIFNKVDNEFQRSRKMIDLVKGQNSEMQTPQTEGLRTFAHAAQVELLRGVQTADETARPAFEVGVAMSMQAIGNALGRFG